MDTLDGGHPSPAPRTRLLVAGVSTRAAAESAARAGFAVTALDAFADRDQHPAVRALSLPRDFGARFSARAAARAAGSVTADAVAYLSSFENHPAAVRALAAGRALWGNAPAVLARVRDPAMLARALRRRGCAAPAMWTGHASPRDAPAGARWLLKPRASGGGHHVRLWRRGEPVPRGRYLQEYVEGTPGSVLFVAAGGRAVVLGVSRQIVGDASFGAAAFRWCGNVLAGADDPAWKADGPLAAEARALADAVAGGFGLVGVGGVDFVVARDGRPYAVEVNPRWTASMELVERACGVSVMAAHAGACAEGALPSLDLGAMRRAAPAVGKAVVFARHDVVVGDTERWLADADVRDVPHEGERIAAGRPVCTVFAEGRDAAACRDALARRAERVYAELAAWERAVA